MTNVIKTELVVRATAKLDEELAEELKKQDPTLEKAKAIINENTTGNDRDGSNRNNHASGESIS